MSRQTPEMTSPMISRAVYGVLILWLTSSIATSVDGRNREAHLTRGSHQLKVRHGGTMLKITTVLIEPYVMAYNDSYSPDDRTSTSPLYYGYLVDLLDKIGDMLGFRYTLHPVEDGEFGFPQQDGSGKWTGMIGVLLDKKADLAAAPMYVTSRRAEVIDFSLPFLHVYAAAVMTKRPDGSHNRITTITDVSLGDSLKLGTLNRGLIHRALKLSNSTFIQHLYDRMQRNYPRAFTSSNEQGLRYVRNIENYVYVLPSNIAEYISNKKPCDLHLINTTMFKQSLALAGQKDSALIPYVDDALSRLKDSGELDVLHKKWWIDKGECSSDNKRDAPELSIRSEHMTNVKESSAPYLSHNGAAVSLSTSLTMLLLTVLFPLSCLSQTLS